MLFFVLLLTLMVYFVITIIIHMKKFVKVITFLLILVVLVPVFSGCDFFLYDKEKEEKVTEISENMRKIKQHFQAMKELNPERYIEGYQYHNSLFDDYYIDRALVKRFSQTTRDSISLYNLMIDQNIHFAQEMAEVVCHPSFKFNEKFEYNFDTYAKAEKYDTYYELVLYDDEIYGNVVVRWNFMGRRLDNVEVFKYGLYEKMIMNTSAYRWFDSIEYVDYSIVMIYSELSEEYFDSWNISDDSYGQLELHDGKIDLLLQNATQVLINAG